MTAIRTFMETHFSHFNARETLAAARGWRDLLETQQGKMFVTLAGAMSTAELGKSLAEMIRRDKVHAICCTAANLEEDLFNLIAHDSYRLATNYRDLTPEEEDRIRQQGFKRVTDVCLPFEAFVTMFDHLLPVLQAAQRSGQRAFPYEHYFRMIEQVGLAKKHPERASDSWVLAAREKQIPIFSPGFEDSTMGNMVVAAQMSGKLDGYNTIKSGLEMMESLAGWYETTSRQSPIGFFQIGGGIAGDFPICVVPMLIEDLGRQCPYWAYFAQIGDSTTSYGSYSGAVPNEKITWGKLSKETPSFMIQSDATIVAPLIFAYVLGW